MTSTSDSNTNLSGAGSNAGMAASNAASTGAGAGEHRSSGQDAHTVHDAQLDTRDARVADFDKDTGTDERYEVESADRSSVGWLNAKRTYDLHQTLDSEAILLSRREQTADRERSRMWDDRENQIRLRHIDAEFNQRMRHADFQVTALAAVTKEMVETISDRVADKVCARMKTG